MIAGKKVLGIIPARDGSKGLPGKNTHPLCGKPLIAWSIEAGLACPCLDEVMVTTDSPEIAAVASQFGAQVPFLRPAHLASDTATSFDAIKHTLDFYRDRFNRTFDLFVLLEPTSPLREVSDINQALEALVATPDAEAVMSFCRCDSVHPSFMVCKDDHGFLKPFAGTQIEAKRRQDLPEVFFPEGTIYASTVAAYLQRCTFFHDRTLVYAVPRWKSPEVDDMYDLVMIEAIMKYRQRTQT